MPWARTRLIQLRLIFLIKTSKPSETLNLSDGLILNKKRVRALGHTRVLSILLHLDCKFKTQNQRSQVEQLKSQIGSLGGNVHIQAAGAYAQQAADVSAARDIDIRAQSIDIAAGRNLGSSHQSERDVKIGSFAKVSSPLIDLVNAVEGAAKSKAEGRTRALQGMAAAARGYQAYDALSGGGAIAKAEAGVGFKTANHSQNQSHAQSLGNSLAAGGHLNLQATAGDIRLQHTDAKAGGKLALDAAQNIVLESGQSQQHLDGKNSSTGLSVGVGASVGAQTGLYVYAEAGAAKAKTVLMRKTTATPP